MNKKLFWLSFYYGQPCILHPKTGRWTLTGSFDGQVVCHRTTKGVDEESVDEDECEFFPIEDVKFILKQGNPFLLKALSKVNFFNSYEWMKNKALSGYWVFYESGFNQVIFEE
jgi:hypothetical protein